jgi:hypothetical protein
MKLEVFLPVLAFCPYSSDETDLQPNEQMLNFFEKTQF